MKINFNLGLSEKENPEKQSEQEITYNWVLYAVAKKYEKGLKGQLLRVFGRLQRKFEEAIDNKADEIQLEEVEKDLIKKSFCDETEFPPYSSKIVTVIMQEVEKFNKEEKE